MSQQVIHSQSHLYPCQLASLEKLSSQRFLFYSPLNSYGSQFNCSNEEVDYFDLEMRKYSILESLGIQNERRQVAIFGNEDHFMLRNQLNESEVVINEIQFSKSGKLVSNFIALSDQTCLNRSNKLKSNSAFVTVKNGDHSASQRKDSQQCRLQLNFLNLSFPHQPEMNPEEQKILEKQQTYDYQGFYHINDARYESQNNVDSIMRALQIPLVLGQNSQAPFQSYQLIEDKFNYGYEDRTFFLFDKKSSVVHHLNVCSDMAITQTIQCDTNSEYDRKTQFQSNKITQISHNLLINYDSNGIVKLIDTRYSRVAQIRNLMEEMNGNGQFNLLAKQQNHIKFYDNERNQLVRTPLKPMSKFLINLSNEIVEIDLRSNQTNQRITFFKSIMEHPIGNYEMSVQNDSRYLAYTSEAHSSFKGFVIKQTSN